MPTGMRVFHPPYIAPGVYAVRDEFTDIRGAGFDDSESTPGVCHRHVDDTNSKLSITADGLTFIAGGSIANPGLWLKANAREAALMLAKVTPIANVSDDLCVGFASDGSTLKQGLTFSSALTLKMMASTPYDVGNYVSGTEYLIAILTRVPKGAYVWIKGGAFAHWTLLMVDTYWQINTSWLAPSVYAGSTLAEGKCRWIRRITARYLPPLVAYDTLSRADGALGNTEAVGPEGQALAPVAWNGPTWAISDGVAINTPGGASLVADPGLEANYTAGLCDSLIKSGTVVTTQGADANVYEGVKSQGASGLTTGGYLAFPAFAAVAGTFYRLAVWGKKIGSTGGSPVARLFWGTTYTASATMGDQVFTRYISCLIPTNNNNIIPQIVYASSNMSAQRYLDDCELYALNTADVFATVNAGTPDVLAEVFLDLQTTGSYAGLALRVNDPLAPTSFIVVDQEGNNIRARQCNAGAWTELGSWSSTYTADKFIRVRVTGSVLSIFAGTSGNLLAKVTTTVLAGNYHGLFSMDAASKLRNFSLWSLGGAGEYDTALDAYTS